MALVVLVVGTGTDVGKTHVTGALVRAARARGLRATAWKPVATGAPDGMGDDARALATACAPDDELVPPLFAYGPPIAPHLAARLDARPIDGRAIARRARELADDHRVDVLVVEGAGGLYTPLCADYTQATLARDLAPEVIVLVAPDRLGVLHDVTACVRAACADGLHNLAVALSAPATTDASTGTNAAELLALGVVDAVTPFPRAAATDARTLDAATALLDRVLGAAPGHGRASRAETTT